MTTHIDDGARAAELAADVRAGLTASPKTLPPKYFYDAVGSELFDEITRLPEYYPTRTERAILAERADEIALRTGAETLIEIGSGTSEKTRLLLHALAAHGSLRHFVPFDVDPAVLTAASAAINQEFPALSVEPVVGDFEKHLHLLPRGGRRLIAFLGSTIGNLEPQSRLNFLRSVRATMSPGDAFLLGTDLVKPADRLVAAYDDADGVTARFNKNVLRVVNRELDADFDLDGFEHVAVWDELQEWIEMRLRSRRSQAVHIGRLGMQVRFDAGEQLRTEISAKFRRERVADELARSGLRLTQWWTDPSGDFALSLSVVEQ
ncbi:MAG TPA: L-histidine N(alpha)-methyltransferase [Jatrophihabitantaceae bacterium]|nr:L-histidine N(alpha)-methyltransferase [Jatrophihabitantaceae bacterium]